MAEWRESSNTRPGEPLRSWVDHTDVVVFDAIATIRMADAHDALAHVIAGAALSDPDLIALGRLNSYSVARWYEPVVTLMRQVHIDDNIAAFFEPLLPRARG